MARILSPGRARSVRLGGTIRACGRRDDGKFGLCPIPTETILTAPVRPVRAGSNLTPLAGSRSPADTARHRHRNPTRIRAATAPPGFTPPGGPPPGPPPYGPPGQGPPEPPRRNLGPWIGGGAAVAVIIVVGLILFFTVGQPDDNTAEPAPTTSSRRRARPPAPRPRPPRPRPPPSPRSRAHRPTPPDRPPADPLSPGPPSLGRPRVAVPHPMPASSRPAPNRRSITALAQGLVDGISKGDKAAWPSSPAAKSPAPSARIPPDPTRRRSTTSTTSG